MRIAHITDEQLQQAYRYAMSLSNDTHVAKDIVHSTYVKLLARDLTSIECVQHYFFRCIRHTFIDKKRFDDRWQTDDVSPPDDAFEIGLVNLESVMIYQDYLVKLWANFAPNERELLYLWAIEEYTIDEISQLTDTARGTLLSRMHRLRKRCEAKALLEDIV